MLEQWNDRLEKARFMSGVLKVEGGEFGDEVAFQMEKPNKARIVGKKQETFSNEHNMWHYLPESKSYYKYAASPELPRVSPFLLGFEAFFGKPSDFEYASERRTKFDGVDVLAVTVNQLPARTTMFGKFGVSSTHFSLTHHFDLASKRLLGTTMKLPMADVTTRLQDLAFEKQKGVSFAWSPPKDAKLIATVDYDSLLLPAETKAPDFNLPTESGKEIRLSDYVKGKKAALITFWFYGCAGCMIEYPHLDELNRKLQGKGLAILGVNPIDPVKEVVGYYKLGKFSFPSIISKGTAVDLAAAYKVQAYPTNLSDRSRPARDRPVDGREVGPSPAEF